MLNCLLFGKIVRFIFIRGVFLFFFENPKNDKKTWTSSFEDHKKEAVRGI